MKMKIGEAPWVVMGIVAGAIVFYVPIKLGDALLRLFPGFVRDALMEAYGYDPGK